MEYILSVFNRAIVFRVLRLSLIANFAYFSCFPVDVFFSSSGSNINWSVAHAQKSESQINKSVGKTVQLSQISRTNKEFIERAFPLEQVFLRNYWLKKMSAELNDKPIRISQHENKIVYDFKNNKTQVVIEILPTFPNIKLNGKTLEFKKGIKLGEYMDQLTVLISANLGKKTSSFSLFPEANATVHIAVVGIVLVIGVFSYLYVSPNEGETKCPENSDNKGKDEEGRLVCIVNKNTFIGKALAPIKEALHGIGGTKK